MLRFGFSADTKTSLNLRYTDLVLIAPSQQPPNFVSSKADLNTWQPGAGLPLITHPST